jgi:hypothetical protein
LFGIELDLFRFAAAKTETIAAELEFERVAEWRGAETSKLYAGRDAHFQQAAANVVAAGHLHYAA